MKKSIKVFGILLTFVVLVVLGGCSSQSQQQSKFDEVIYDCGNYLVKGTEIPNSQWDLKNGVESYFLYGDNYSIKYDYPLRKWFENADAVGLNKGEDGCKELLRFYNYTEVKS